MGRAAHGGRLGKTLPGWSLIKSVFSSRNGNCVEVESLPGDGVGIRDSKDHRGPVLRFTPSEWSAFIEGVRNGEFDGQTPPGRDNRYSFLKWVLESPWRTLGLALLLAVGVIAAVLAPHLLVLFL